MFEYEEADEITAAALKCLDGLELCNDVRLAVQVSQSVSQSVMDSWRFILRAGRQTGRQAVK